MHEPEDDTHDLSDDSDYEASQQQQGFGGRSTIGSDSAEMGGGDSFDEGSEFEVVFWRDHVAIHPTQIASERISGRLRLAKQQSNLFLTWMPYKPSFDGMDSSGHVYNSDNADRNLYTIRDVPISDVHSIRRHTPPIGWQYVIVVLSSGLAYPPLYFYNGGVREFLATIKQHVLITRYADDANVFLVNNFQDPLQKSLSSLELPRAVPVVNVPALHNSVSPLENSQILNGVDYDGGSSTSGYSGIHKHKAHDPARDASIQVLEKFSLVTKFARDTTSQIYRECQNIGFNNSERKQRTDSFPMNEYSRLPNEIQSNPDENLIFSDPLESEKLNQLWGKPRQCPLNSEEWDAFLDSEGRIMDSEALRKRIFYGGVESNLRKEVWKFLLGYHAYDSTFAERAYLDSAKRSEYETLKSQWKSISSEQAKRFTKFRERRALIEKDVVRTDRSIPYYDGDDNPHVELLHDILLTYSFYNFDLGYCQGMSDLLSPLLFIMEDESESFWCFAALMERLGPNFNRDQSGMHSQLFALSKLVEILDQPLHDYFKQKDCLNYFFCFRWLLIQFKREFEYEKVMRLWEILWTYYLSEHFHLYVCTAILKRYRKKIMGEEMDFDTLLKFINELSGHIDLDDIIRYAEALCMRAGEHGAACIPPGTPPSFPLETDTGCYSQPDEL